MLYTREKGSFEDIDTSGYIKFKEAGALVQDNEILQSLKALDALKCQECHNAVFTTLNKLKEHMRKTHGLYYWYLGWCVVILVMFA